MSNLKLPTMTFEALSNKVAPGKSRKLAYATEAHRTDAGDTIYITQHNNTIAKLTSDTVYVDNCGYDTTTTATRLRKILGDNNIGYYVRIKNYAMRLYNTAHIEVDGAFRSVTLHNLGGGVWATDYASLS